MRSAAAPVTLAPPRVAARRLVRRGAAGRALLYLILLAGAATMLFPFLWMLSTSLKPEGALLVTPPDIVPSHIDTGAYTRIATDFPVFSWIRNSLLVAALAASLQVVTSAMGAYAFARIRFPGRDLLFLAYLSTLMVPLQVTIVPLFLEMRFLHLVDTLPGLVLPAVASAFGTFLLRQAMLGLPRDLEEAAFIDGAGHWTVFRRIVLPLVKPSLATLAIFAFMGSWNSFLWPLVIVNSTDLMTLPVGLSTLNGEHMADWNLLMAGATLSVIPILIVYVLAQRHVIQGMTLSGIKG